MSDDDRTLPSSERPNETPAEKLGFPDEYTCGCGKGKSCPTVRLEPDGSVSIFEPGVGAPLHFRSQQAHELRQWLESKGF